MGEVLNRTHQPGFVNEYPCLSAKSKCHKIQNMFPTFLNSLNSASLICTRVQGNQIYLDIKGSLTQCWRNVGPPSASSPQQTLSVSCLLRSMPGHSLHHPRGTVTRRGHNVGLMLARRLRRRPTINPTLC